MKNLKNKLLAFTLGAALVVGSAVGMTACGGDDGADVDPEIYAVYTAYAAEGGKLSYEEWYNQLLENAKGAKGEKGDKGDKGDTGAQGPAGPQGPQGDKGDTGATGPAGSNGTNGTNGTNGADGSSFLHGEGAPDSSLGKSGDLYLDTLTWDVYEKTEEGWGEEPIGNIKGAQGEKGEKGDKGDKGDKGEKGDPGTGGGAEADLPSVTVSVTAGGTQEVDLPAEVTAGVWVMKADIGSASLSAPANPLNAGTKYDGGRFYTKIGENPISYLFPRESLGQSGHNVLYGYLVVAEGDTKVSFTSTVDELTATVTFEQWEAPTLKADGVKVEIPVNPTEAVNILKINLDSSLEGGTYTLKVVDFVIAISQGFDIIVDSNEPVTIYSSKNKQENVWYYDETTITLTGGETEIYIKANGTGINDVGKNIAPITVTLTPVE